MIGEVRNVIVHQRGIITKEDLKKLPKCFNDFFTTSPEKGKHLIKIKPFHSQVFSAMANYIFLIYKAVATRCYDESVEIKRIR